VGFTQALPSDEVVVEAVCITGASPATSRPQPPDVGVRWLPHPPHDVQLLRGEVDV
jgi:hypothetical protein